MSSNYQILDEQPQHVEEVQRVTIAAFASAELGYHGEAELVATMRRRCPNHLSLVASDGRQVVGHVFFSPATIRTAAGSWCGMALGPMAVEPSHQRCGVGTKLVIAGLRRLDGQRTSFAVVFGHPSFYSRFGFEPAGRYQLVHGFDGLPQEFLMVRWLVGWGPITGGAGQIDYDPAFGP